VVPDLPPEQQRALRRADGAGFRAPMHVADAERARLDPLAAEESPFADRVRHPGRHGVRPELVCAVGFSEWTTDGRLRHPRYQGLREDKDPAEVVREQ
jgi:bifunctional non-homologous end joining protein LigD